MGVALAIVAALTAGTATATMRASGYIDGLAVVPTEDSERQLPQALGVLRLDDDVTRWLHAHAEIHGRFGGPYEGGHPGVHDLVHTFQNYSPAFDARELYADVRLPSLDVRAGIQRFAWGKLDGAPPTDVLNPRDFHDPLVMDYEESKIGVPAIQATYYLRDVPAVELEQVRAMLVYVPIAVPSRLPLLEERWFPPAALPAEAVPVRKAVAEMELDEAFFRVCQRPRFRGLLRCQTLPDTFVRKVDPVDVHLHTANDRAPYTLSSGGIGARLVGVWRGIDWDLYHYTGPETGPDAQLAGVVLSSRDFSTTGRQNFVDLGRVNAALALKQRLSTIHMTGLDWAAAVGDVSLRGEVAVFEDRPYLRLARNLITPTIGAARLPTFAKRFVRAGDPFDPNVCSRERPCRGPVRIDDLFPRLDSVEWGMGADYLTHGTFMLLQVNQTVLRQSAPRLVIDDPETRFTGVVRRQFLRDRVELEMRAAYTITRGGWFVFPRASYTLFDALRIRVGYLAIGGSRNSLFGQFGRNDELVLDLRYAF